MPPLMVNNIYTLNNTRAQHSKEGLKATKDKVRGEPGVTSYARKYESDKKKKNSTEGYVKRTKKIT